MGGHVRRNVEGVRRGEVVEEAEEEAGDEGVPRARGVHDVALRHGPGGAGDDLEGRCVCVCPEWSSEREVKGATMSTQHTGPDDDDDTDDDAPPVRGHVNEDKDVASGNSRAAVPASFSKSAARPMTMLPSAPKVVQTIFAWPPSKPRSAAIPSSVLPLPVNAFGKCALVTR